MNSSPKSQTFLAFVGLAGLFTLCLSDCFRDSSPRTKLAVPAPGQIPIATSRNALWDLSQGRARPESIFYVDSSVAIQVIDHGLLSSEIQLPDGRRGWVASEWVDAK